MSTPIPQAPQGNVPVIGIPDSQDIPRLVYCAPYFNEVPLAELIEPSVIEAVEAALPSLVPPYVDNAAQAAVQEQAVLLTGSAMSGPLFLSPLMPTQPSQAATMSYVDSMIATAGIPEVPPVPSGQVWARETGQWVPITPQTGVFLPLAGGSMTGNINMSGNTIQNMAAVPAMPNGAAPAQWVLNQIASVSLYQGTWNADTNTPDLTQLSTHVNAYTWIAITTAVGGVVIGAAIPGLQGLTIFNGDTIIYSTVQGRFMAIHAGGLTLPEADERYVQLAGSQMSGALLLNANASQPLQAVTLQQMQAFVPPGVVPEAPNDGQLYGRNGLTASWAPVLPLAGGILTGSLTLSGNATANLNPVPLQQMTSAITAATAGYLPLAGGTMSGLMSLSGNASANLNPVPLQQLNGMLASYATVAQLANYLPLAGGTLTGTLGALSAVTITNNTAGQNAAVVLNNTVVSGGPAAGGFWRVTSRPSGIMMIDMNTAAAGDYSTIVTPLQIAPSGAFTFGFTGSPRSNFICNTEFDSWIQVDGIPYANQTNFTLISDPRTKTNTADYAAGVSLISQLQPITFSYNGMAMTPNDAAATPPVTRYGLDALATQAVMPALITSRELPLNPGDTSETAILSIGDIMPLTMTMLNALKQLISRVGALETAAGITPTAEQTT